MKFYLLFRFNCTSLNQGVIMLQPGSLLQKNKEKEERVCYLSIR